MSKSSGSVPREALAGAVCSPALHPNHQAPLWWHCKLRPTLLKRYRVRSCTHQVSEVRFGAQNRQAGEMGIPPYLGCMDSKRRSTSSIILSNSCVVVGEAFKAGNTQRHPNPFCPRFVDCWGLAWGSQAQIYTFIALCKHSYSGFPSTGHCQDERPHGCLQHQARIINEACTYHWSSRLHTGC
jgi:hypothetical protein